MNWKNRLTNYNFWISIISAVLLILQALKIEFDIAYINEIATAVLGLLVVIGIISDPTRYTVKDSSNLTKPEKQKSENKKIEEVILNLEENNKITAEQTAETVKAENENSMPINGEDKTDINSVQNDYEDIVKNISEDLNKSVLMDNAVDVLIKFVENLKAKTEVVENNEEKVEETLLENIEDVSNELIISSEEKQEIQKFNNIVN